MTCPECGRDIQQRGLGTHLRSHDAASAAARFWAQVDQSGGPDACWPWTGHENARGLGYGRVNDWFGRDMAHRRAWTLTNGPIPSGMLVRHVVCDNPPCCNPRHLAIGTDQDNSNDAVAHRRTTKGRSFIEQAARGSRKPSAKLTESDIPVIRALVAAGRSHASVAAEYGVSKPAIADIVAGRTWRHVQ